MRKNQCNYLLQITDIGPQPPMPKYGIASKSTVASLARFKLDHSHSLEKKQDLDNIFQMTKAHLLFDSNYSLSGHPKSTPPKRLNPEIFCDKGSNSLNRRPNKPPCSIDSMLLAQLAATCPWHTGPRLFPQGCMNICRPYYKVGLRVLGRFQMKHCGIVRHQHCAGIHFPRSIYLNLRANYLYVFIYQLRGRIHILFHETTPGVTTFNQY